MGRHAKVDHRRRRILPAVAGITALAATAFAGIGVTLAIYSARGNAQDNGFTSGTVTIGNGASSTCTVGNMAPGDAPAPCTMTFSYTGSLAAYFGVDVLIETQAGVGGTPLYNPAGGDGLTVAVTDDQSSPVTYTTPTSATSCPSGAPTGSACYELDNELVGTSSYNSGSVDTISTTVTLPTAAGNGYQGGSAQVVLVAHAVQAAHNAMSCTTTPTAGQPCIPSSGFAWS